jgi:5-methylthioadenosine/S-adenosylhomocysteine deaminase
MTGRAGIIRGGILVDARTRKFDAADILIEGDSIVEVGPPGMKAPETAAEIDARSRLLIPGLINTHTHSHANLPRSVGDRWTLELALNTNPAFRGNMSPEEQYLAAQIGALEMVSKGCTTCYDLLYEFPEPSLAGLNAVAQAYSDIGMRAIIGPLTVSRSFYESVPGLLEALPAEVQAKYRGKNTHATTERSLGIVRQALRDWRFDRDQVRLGVAPTIPGHCTDELLTGAAALAREFGVGFQTHLAESKVQAIAGMRAYGKTLTRRLDDLGVLGPNFTAAHGVWLDDDDMKRLADAGASVSHNPASNMRYGSGMAAVRRMRDFGLNVGLGTDSRTCSDNLNMFEALRLASYTSRVQTPDYKRWLSTDEVMRMGTIDGAKLMGFEGKLGELKAGFKADIVFLDRYNLNYLPLNNAVNQVVNAEDGTGVESVMIGGRMVYENRRFPGIDFRTLSDRADAAMERLTSVNGDAQRLALALEDVVGSICVGLASSPYHVHRYCG